MDLKTAPKQAPAMQPNVLEEMGQVTRRLKLLENTVQTLRQTVQTLEKNLIDQHKENRRDIRVLEEENEELKTSMRDVKENMKLIIQDLKEMAQKEDVEVIKKYLDMWNPVHFVTREQVEKLINDGTIR